ncbi:Chromosome segregation protein SMC [Candidatus Filomicrobium marinum]|uniref:Chromosome segregation protein SMC n=1 Tax=Candidatus Filomicrobium marinum TaxID=1608628 RepID=A0A0D6JG55_9HYPH|nr:AAA family ATPase [Candidatus Filomicrobium marinum]CFX24718.1 Chromosome segregation protein SMC [Candidatus Filomicrobium marinum]CPR19207.1 Chromosome segregation protein SMC [Candidatus Filomicrobium marinum]
MYLKELHVTNFRNVGNGQPLCVPFQQGLNLIVGENDAGKTGLIDAIRYCLGTRGQYYERITISDFFCGDGQQSKEFSIRCVFDGLTPDEVGNFAEWLTNIPGEDGQPGRSELQVSLTAKLQADESVYPERSTGSGKDVDGKLREYLQATYLRPLRDASAELRPGRRSRLAQILQTLPEMRPEKDATVADTLAKIMVDSQKNISDNKTIKNIEKRLREEYLADAALTGTSLLPKLGMGVKFSFEQVIERLQLELHPPNGVNLAVNRGLGLDNVLFMCAELLLLQSEATAQLPLLLVEEPEAHLHPQMQSSVIAMLDNQATNRRKAQILLTTHSPLLAGSADPQNVIMIGAGTTFPLSSSHTKLEPGDYKFLRRFLDATKANLFFAKGVVMVEGDAEVLLLPALAEKIGRPFTKHGVSIVNVGTVGFYRYARIFQRQKPPVLPVPVACITDRDVPPTAAASLLREGRKTEDQFEQTEIQTHIAKKTAKDGEPVKTFVSPCWTLEFDLAEGGLLDEMNRAITRARHTGTKTEETLDQEAKTFFDSLTGTVREKAVKVCEPLLKNGSNLSKPTVAHELASILRNLPDTPEQMRARLPAYLVEAIDYVTSPLTASAPAPAQQATQGSSDAPAQLG